MVFGRESAVADNPLDYAERATSPRRPVSSFQRGEDTTQVVPRDLGSRIQARWSRSR